MQIIDFGIIFWDQAFTLSGTFTIKYLNLHKNVSYSLLFTLPGLAGCQHSSDTSPAIALDQLILFGFTLSAILEFGHKPRIQTQAENKGKSDLYCNGDSQDTIETPNCRYTPAP